MNCRHCVLSFVPFVHRLRLIRAWRGRSSRRGHRARQTGRLNDKWLHAVTSISVYVFELTYFDSLSLVFLVFLVFLIFLGFLAVGYEWQVALSQCGAW